MDYRNTECPVCKKIFSDSDDIVVCPDCGAPYHRNCYELIGNCLYKDVHGTDKAYSPSKSNNDSENNYGDELKSCPRCGANNSKDSMFCESCGFIFGSAQNNSTQGNPFLSGIPFVFDPMGGVDPNEPIDGVPSGEIAKYVRTNTPYYMSIFKKIKDQNKSKFNFGAFLFSGAWFLYRKQYKIGAIITALVFGIMIASSFITYNYTQSIAKVLLNSTGSALNSDSIGIVELVLGSPDLSTLEKILFFMPYILSFLNILIMIFSGAFANRIYLKHSIKLIKSIKEKSTTELDYKNAIGEQGGVNVKILPVLLICYAIIEYLPRFLIK
ncbi:MAG: hypothetical protein RUMPE_01095 [Eubacteriales bacterium SKADARSKE-1]|nr:hypothetical protein [Eubacteriales bacterium SKADARSKE-1]